MAVSRASRSKNPAQAVTGTTHLNTVSIRPRPTKNPAEAGEEKKMSTVTKEFRVDQYDNVYDADGVFYCNWVSLTKDEKKEVKKNPFSAK
jgi:hypothetical protein